MSPLAGRLRHARQEPTEIPEDFDAVILRLASPETILKWSHGEVVSSETINYRTQKPERGGLFCERIFGPVESYVCACERYKGLRYKGVVCDRCGVEVTDSKVRRIRFGHITLMAPVVHTWFFRNTPNYLALLLGLSSNELLSLVYYEKHVVIQPGILAKHGLARFVLINDDQYIAYLKWEFAWQVCAFILERVIAMREERPGRTLRDIVAELRKSLTDFNDPVVDGAYKLLEEIEADAKLLQELEGLLLALDEVRKDQQWSKAQAIEVLEAHLPTLTPEEDGKVVVKTEKSETNELTVALNRMLDNAFKVLEAGGVMERGTDAIYADNEKLPPSDETKIIVKSGGEGIYEWLKRLDLDELASELRHQAHHEVSTAKREALLRRLQIVEAFRKANRTIENRPEWMVLQVIPVIPPELRPLVWLEERGRFYNSDLNELYKRVINRNNRLKRHYEMKAPDIMIRNEKRMLQEAVDSLLDNTRKENAAKKPGSNQLLRSLTHNLKGKKGRFRQNLLGKRVDYSGRSTIVAGPELKLHECGLPKEMALELFKPLVVRRLIDRGVVNSVKMAKELIERREPVVWEVLENVVKGHPVLLNRAPTLHRLSIQAFQPKLVEGDAIMLHPLVCPPYNADFDGDQMAVHVPLSPAAIAEAQLLMLSSHNILSPQNGQPISLPTQDMVLGLYYLTKEKRSTRFRKVRGEGKVFYSPEEALLAYEHGKVDLHALIKVRMEVNGKPQMVETTVGRLIFNEVVPKELGFVNMLVTKKTLKQLTADVIRLCGMKVAADFLDAIKELGFKYSTIGGLSFKLSDLADLGEIILRIRNDISSAAQRGDEGALLQALEQATTLEDFYGVLNGAIDEELNSLLSSLEQVHQNSKPSQKDLKEILSALDRLLDKVNRLTKPGIIEEALGEVEEIRENYNIGLLTNLERYNQTIDVWTAVTNKVSKISIEVLSKHQQGFNPVYMMLDSGARGSEEQIRQLVGLRGLMIRPKKGAASEIIETPILSSFKEGLTMLEYFISTHGARKGLVDTALKTSDAGYLTRRLVDAVHDVIVTQEDCGTIRGIRIGHLKDNEEIVVSMGERILGRVALNDIYHPKTGELLCRAGEVIDEEKAKKIDESGLEWVEIRSVLTCEAREGVCAKCYGWHLGYNRMAQVGDPVGIIAAQSIGEPGTQLTLRTFHTGGVAGGAVQESVARARIAGKVRFENVRVVEQKDDATAEVKKIVVSKMSEICIVDENDPERVLARHSLPYGAELYVDDGQVVDADTLLCKWDPYNSLIIAEVDGEVKFEDVVEGVTYREEVDEQTGHRDKVIVESKERTLVPRVTLLDQNGNVAATYHLPVGAHILVREGQKVKAGTRIAKIPRTIRRISDITGGLPRVVELFEARVPSQAAIVSEIDGWVSFGEIRRGQQQVIVTSRDGEKREYWIPLTRYLLVQENDFVRAGTPLCDGNLSPKDILRVRGLYKLQEYLVGEIREIYRLQGVDINEKHIEVVVRQMLKKVRIVEPGDTDFLPGEIVDKWDFVEANENLYNKKVIEDAGDSERFRRGDIVSYREVREENARLIRENKRPMKYRDAQPAIAQPEVIGIRDVALRTKSWFSAASFQDTSRVLAQAAIEARRDDLRGLKENVITGRLIPAGTGLIKQELLEVFTEEEMERAKQLER